MLVKMSIVLIQTMFFLIVNLSSISKAQYYPSAGYYANRNALEMPYKNKVSIKVYYETHCPYCIKFFKEQLAPTVTRLGSRLDVHLIPYGHAKTYFKNGQYTFDCQHGDIECYGNMLHASAIDIIRNNTKAVLFNTCIMEKTNDSNVLNSLVNSCGYKYNVPVNGIWENMNSGRGALLLKGYGDETTALRPRYVPYVLIDGAVADDVTIHHLGYFVCRLLNPRPDVCDLV